MKQVCAAKFRRQQPIGPYVADFVSFEAGLIIEIDGGQHADETNLQHDACRTRYLESRGFRVIRFWNFEVHASLDDVLESIASCIDSNSPSPSP